MTQRMVVCLCLLASAGLVQAADNTDLPFDPKEVVRQMRSSRSEPSAVSRGPSALNGEFLIDTSGVHAEYDPAVAFDGTNYLVVWQDYRNNRDTSDIYGARVSQAGTVIDPTGIAISTAAYGQESPAVAFDGTNFLVAWTDYRNNPDISDIYGARVSLAGVVLDPDGVAISTAAYHQVSPAGSFDGTNWLVVWMDEGSGVYYDIYGARVTPAGSVLDPNGIPISTAADWQFYPAVSFDGTNWLVVWEDWCSYPDINIYGVRVTPAGVVFDSGPVVMQEGSQCYPALARGTGSQTFLVYQGWAGTVGGKTYNTERIWGKFGPLAVVQETPNAEVRTPNSGPTIVRGVLWTGDSRQNTGYRAGLLDISGRKVADLKPGPNDIRHLAPGVYFVREQSAVSSQHSGRSTSSGEQPAQKVVIQK